MEPVYVVYDKDRFSDHKRNFYDVNWNYVKVDSDCPCFEDSVKKPENYEKMVEIASVLSRDFPAVRVDLYNIEGKIYFGELTFSPTNGVFSHYTQEFLDEMGAKLVI